MVSEGVFREAFLIDSHAHLDFPQFQTQEQAIVARAKDAGVAGIVSIGTRPESWEKIAELTQRFPQVWGTVGLHPCDSAVLTPKQLLAQLKPFLAYPKIIGLGETGLDFFHEPFDAPHQEACLAVHQDLGLQYGLPLVIHSRNAEAATLRCLKPFMQKGGRCVIHCFSGSADFAKACVDLGCFVSFSGIITFKKADEVRRAAELVPLDRILVETDAPYLAPEPFRGKTNEPAFVQHTAKRLADIKNISFEELARATTHNFFTLFNKAAGSGKKNSL